MSTVDSIYQALAHAAGVIPWPLMAFAVLVIVLVQIMGDVLSAVAAGVVIFAVLGLLYMHYTGASAEGVGFWAWSWLKASIINPK